MDFRTKFKVKPFEQKISHQDKLFFLGSCFAENISKYFEKSRFQVLKNPFGILYHPTAIKRLIEIAIDSDYNPESHSFQFNDVWSSFDAHSSLSNSVKSKLLENLQSSKLDTEKALKTSDVVFISLGTVWVYRHIDSNKIVSNCHKIPQKEFEKRFLQQSEVDQILDYIIQQIIRINPKAKIIFTLSPVRHLKDGFVENQMSKSILHLSIQRAVQNYDEVQYFPSYELLLDDLRDYRFYDKDMIHPNQIALDYIWLQLKNAFFSEETESVLKRVESINDRLSHRFFNPDSAASQGFAKKTHHLIRVFSREHPYIKF